MGRLKIAYPICCGMDVHRDFVIACIASTNAQGVTIARRLLTAIYHMLLKDEPYQPFIAPVQNAIPKQRMMTAEDALAMLRRKGYTLFSRCFPSICF